MFETGILKELRDAMMCLLNVQSRFRQPGLPSAYLKKVEQILISIKVLLHEIEDDWIGS